MAKKTTAPFSPVKRVSQKTRLLEAVEKRPTGRRPPSQDDYQESGSDEILLSTSQTTRRSNRINMGNQNSREHFETALRAQHGQTPPTEEIQIEAPRSSERLRSLPKGETQSRRSRKRKLATQYSQFHEDVFDIPATPEHSKTRKRVYIAGHADISPRREQKRAEKHQKLQSVQQSDRDQADVQLRQEDDKASRDSRTEHLQTTKQQTRAGTEPETARKSRNRKREELQRSRAQPQESYMVKDRFDPRGNAIAIRHDDSSQMPDPDPAESPASRRNLRSRPGCPDLQSAPTASKEQQAKESTAHDGVEQTTDIQRAQEDGSLIGPYSKDRTGDPSNPRGKKQTRSVEPSAERSRSADEVDHQLAVSVPETMQLRRSHRYFAGKDDQGDAQRPTVNPINPEELSLDSQEVHRLGAEATEAHAQTDGRGGTREDVEPQDVTEPREEKSRSEDEVESQDELESMDSVDLQDGVNSQEESELDIDDQLTGRYRILETLNGYFRDARRITKISDQHEDALEVRGDRSKHILKLCETISERYQNTPDETTSSNNHDDLKELDGRLNDLKKEALNLGKISNLKRKEKKRHTATSVNIHGFIIPDLVRLLRLQFRCSAIRAEQSGQQYNRPLAKDDLVVLSETVKMIHDFLDVTHLYPYIKKFAIFGYRKRLKEILQKISKILKGLRIQISRNEENLQHQRDRREAEVQHSQQSERREREQKDLDLWARLYEERLDAEGGVLSVFATRGRQAVESLRFPCNWTLDLDANGERFERIEIFGPRSSPPPHLVEQARNRHWSMLQLATLTDALKKFAPAWHGDAREIFIRIFRTYCCRHGVLVDFNAMEIVTMATDVRGHFAKLQRNGVVEDWVKAVPVLVRPVRGDEAENLRR